MPRITRMITPDQETVYHVISRTVLDGYPLGDEEKVPVFRFKWASLSELVKGRSNRASQGTSISVITVGELCGGSDSRV